MMEGSGGSMIQGMLSMYETPDLIFGIPKERGRKNKVEKARKCIQYYVLLDY